MNRSADKESMLAQINAEIAEAEVILTAWRNRFPNNAYAWPGAPTEFAVEAMRAMKSRATDEQITAAIVAELHRQGEEGNPYVSTRDRDDGCLLVDGDVNLPGLIKAIRKVI